MTLGTLTTESKLTPEPLWPGFSHRSFPVEDPLGRHASIEVAPPPLHLLPGESEILALQHVHASVVGSDDPGQAVHAALRAALDVMSADVGSLWLYQADGALVRVAHCGLTPEYLDEFSNRPGWDATQQQVLAEPDVQVQAHGAGHHEGPVQIVLPPGIKSTVVIPLRTRGLRVGGLLLGHASAEWAGKHSRDFMRTLGEILAGSLDAARMTADLRAGSELTEGLLRVAHDAIVMVNPEGVITEANPALERMLGYSRTELLGRPLAQFVCEPERLTMQANLGALIELGVPIVGGSRSAVHRDGSLIPLAVNATRFTDSVGHVRGAVGVLHDLREHRADVGKVRDAHDRLTHLLRHLDVGVGLIRRSDLTIEEFNPALKRVLNVPDLEGRKFSQLLPEREWSEMAALMSQALAAGSARSLENLDVRLSGCAPMQWSVTLSPMTPLAGGEVSHMVLTIADITARRDLEERYRHAQKMEAVGTLAGGIAHEFNNLLTAIIGNVTLSLLDLPEYHPLAPGLRDCESAAQRAADLTRQLLGFGRRTPMRARATDLREVIADSLPLVSRGADPRILIERDDAADLWLALADPSHIGQALMNLCVNARDAMPDGGRLRVVTRNIPAEDVPERSGEFVMIEVTDTGQGIAPELLERIYEPFFTTRGSQHGPGLGLAVVYGIVEQHGGWIDCVSSPGEGTSFRLYLPRDKAESASVMTEPGHGEVVLVVDDEDSVRALARAVLERLGYRVRQAADGVEALELVRAAAGSVSIVVLDQTMPRLSGIETLRELRRVAPSLPVILTSGYEPGGGPQGDEDIEADGFLPKPYPPDALGRLVRQLLDSRAGAADTGVTASPPAGPTA